MTSTAGTSAFSGLLPPAPLPDPLPASALFDPLSCPSFNDSPPMASLPDLLCSPFPYSDSESGNDFNLSPATQTGLPDFLGDFAGASPFIPTQPSAGLSGLSGSSKPVDDSSMMMFPGVAPVFPATPLPSFSATKGSCTMPSQFMFGLNTAPLSNVFPAATSFTPGFTPEVTPGSSNGTPAVQTPDASPVVATQTVADRGNVSACSPCDDSSSSASMHAPRAHSTEVERPSRCRGSRHRRTRSDVVSKVDRSSVSHCHSSTSCTPSSRTSRPGAFVCPDCGRRFNRSYNLAAHSLIHDPNQPRPYICPSPSCHKAFARKYDARRHFAKLHIGPDGCPADWIDLIVDTHSTGRKRR